MERTGLDCTAMAGSPARLIHDLSKYLKTVPDWEEKDRAAVTAIIAAHENGDTASIQALAAMIKLLARTSAAKICGKRLEKTKKW